MKPLILIIGEVRHTIKQGEYIIIGRDPQYNIVFQNNEISRKHATILHESDGQVCLIDHKSKNGTYYNEKRILNSERITLPGKIKLGPISLYLQREDETTKENKIPKESTEINLDLD